MGGVDRNIPDGGEWEWVMGRVGKFVLGLAALVAAMPASALPAQSWNGYRWARTANLAIKIGDNVSAAWDPYLAAAAQQWSAAALIDFVPVAGTSVATTCGGVYGTVQVCSGNYGATGWLGYTSVWLGGGFINKVTIKLNDYYFSQPKYNTEAWRAQTVCHEGGHALGLAHTNDVRTNANTGSCMDVTNDPSGLLAGYGLANIAPNAVDFAALAAIYAKVNTTQLPQTRTIRATSALMVEGFDEIETIAFVPEPGAWAMMIAGFGLVGSSMRRRHSTRFA